MAGPDDDNERREAERILKRVSAESEGGGMVAGAMRRTQGHLAAEDVDRADPIEYWGTRIGRGLGAVVTVLLIGWLIFYLAGG